MQLTVVRYLVGGPSVLNAEDLARQDDEVASKTDGLVLTPDMVLKAHLKLVDVLREAGCSKVQWNLCVFSGPRGYHGQSCGLHKMLKGQGPGVTTDQLLALWGRSRVLCDSLWDLRLSRVAGGHGSTVHVWSGQSQHSCMQSCLASHANAQVVADQLQSCSPLH